MTEKHYEFGLLKAKYSKANNDSEKQEILRQMRENMLERNGKESIVELFYPKGEEIDIVDANDMIDIFRAEAALTNQGK